MTDREKEAARMTEHFNRQRALDPDEVEAAHKAADWLLGKKKKKPKRVQSSRMPRACKSRIREMKLKLENQIALDLDRYSQAFDQIARMAETIKDVGRGHFGWWLLSEYDILGSHLVVEHPDLCIYMHRWMASGWGYAKKADTDRLYLYIRFAWLGVATPWGSQKNRNAITN